jgi:hypothetical protein
MLQKLKKFYIPLISVKGVFLPDSPTTFEAYPDHEYDNPNFTIAKPTNLLTKSFKMFDSRDAQYLPIRVSETFPKLTEYIVEWCGIKEVNMSNFVGLSDLKTLSLSQNVITTIYEKSFDDLVNLEDLSLSQNLLTSLPENIFGRLENLKHLDLSSNNELETLPSKIFDPLKSLEILKLKHTNIKVLDGQNFSRLEKIQKISMFGSKIEKIKNMEKFSEFKNLTELNLSENTCIKIVFNGTGEIKTFLKSPSECFMQN